MTLWNWTRSRPIFLIYLINRDSTFSPPMSEHLLTMRRKSLTYLFEGEGEGGGDRERVGSWRCTATAITVLITEIWIYIVMHVATSGDSSASPPVHTPHLRLKMLATVLPTAEVFEQLCHRGLYQKRTRGWVKECGGRNHLQTHWGGHIGWLHVSGYTHGPMPLWTPLWWCKVQDSDPQAARLLAKQASLWMHSLLASFPFDLFLQFPPLTPKPDHNTKQPGPSGTIHQTYRSILKYVWLLC